LTIAICTGVQNTLNTNVMVPEITEL